MKSVFFIAGRTGGPFFPLPTVAKYISDYHPIYIGIRGGFEYEAQKRLNFQLCFLPDTRLTILSFKREKLSETIANYWKLFLSLLKIGWSFVTCLYLLLRFQPAGIYSTGSFLAVPMIYAARITNFLRLTKARIIIHQQDPLPGLANSSTMAYADLKTCVFNYTRKNYPHFNDCRIIPNPINYELYEASNRMTVRWEDEYMRDFCFAESEKPLMLIFGGGSGSEDINVWTMKNILGLLDHFRVVHLTGILQTKQLDSIDHPDYLRRDVVFSDMPKLMRMSDLVLCRAGMASITELLYLYKPAFLVPLPSTHQEKNAEMVKDYFYILDQKDRPDWLETILEVYPSYFKSITYPDREEVKAQLHAYYETLKKLLEQD